VADQIIELGATPVALTPQLAEHSLTMTERHKLKFDLLSDPGNVFASQLGLTFTVPDDLREVYLSLGIDLPKHNGEDSWTLPMPARYVIDSGGIIRAADIDPDYTHRPEPEKTLADFEALA
jgi:peroxiredoxin